MFTLENKGGMTMKTQKITYSFKPNQKPVVKITREGKTIAKMPFMLTETKPIMSYVYTTDIIGKEKH